MQNTQRPFLVLFIVEQTVFSEARLPWLLPPLRRRGLRELTVVLEPLCNRERKTLALGTDSHLRRDERASGMVGLPLSADASKRWQQPTPLKLTTSKLYGPLSSPALVVSPCSWAHSIRIISLELHRSFPPACCCLSAPPDCHLGPILSFFSQTRRTWTMPQQHCTPPASWLRSTTPWAPVSWGIRTETLQAVWRVQRPSVEFVGGY